MDSLGDEVVYGGGGFITPEVDPPEVFTRPEVDVLMKLTLLRPTFSGYYVLFTFWTLFFTIVIVFLQP